MGKGSEISFCWSGQLFLGEEHGRKKEGGLLKAIGGRNWDFFLESRRSGWVVHEGDCLSQQCQCPKQEDSAQAFVFKHRSA